MENPPSVSPHKEIVKQKIEELFKGFKEPLCSQKNCINPCCLNYLRQLSKKPDEADFTDQEKLSTAVKYIKADSNMEVVNECPPAPLDHNEVDALLEENDEKRLLTRISEVFGNLKSLASSFYPIPESSTKFSLKECSLKIDFQRLLKIYDVLSSISESEEGIYEKILKESITNLTEQVVKCNSPKFKHMMKPCIRVIVLLLAQEKLYDPSLEEITSLVTEYFFELEGMKFWNREAAEKFLSDLDFEEFNTIIKVNQQQLTFLMFEKPDEGSEEIEGIRKYFLLLDFFFYTNRRRSYKNRISFKEFHNDILNREWDEDLPDMYIDWYKERRRLNEDDMDIDTGDQLYDLDKRNGKFVYMMFPWSYDAGSKSRMMKYESQIQQKKEIHNSFRNIMDIISNNIYLVVLIRREQLIEDALNNLVSAGNDLKKPLKVKFKDEPGVDEGGVQKEFFQLLIRELFDIGYGMFEYNEETQLYWIKKDTFESPLKFELIGIIIGLAIYNSNILDIQFPLAMYKKLLNYDITLEDFAQYDPQVAKSLKAILDYDKDDINEVMGFTFVAEYESWGAKVEEELKEGGKTIEVTQANKEEYVHLYIDFMINKSVSKWFDAFKKGFIKCCHGEVLEMLEPEDLEMLVCGSKVLDFSELKKVTVYQDGFTAESQTVINFWEIIEELSEEEKKKFLSFCTGCDRAPINGLGKLRFYISKHGDNDDHLPSVHTCFNHLLIPDYSTKEILREKLLKAINNSEGFGLI